MTRIATYLLAAFVAASFLGAPPAVVAADGAKSIKATGREERHFTAKEVFDYRQAVIFHDDFRSLQFGKWNFSEDDRYRIPHETPERIAILEAPGLGAGRKAVRFAVPRAPNSFRAEISLPSETGFNERWYGERILVPRDWVLDPAKGNDLVMQWHAVPGNGKATYPNLEISIGNTNWFIRQSCGCAKTKPTHTNVRLDDPVRPGAWVSWVIHAKWSAGSEGLLEIWRDGKKVMERRQPNVYSDIGVEYTPYLKTGIYHPEWHLDTDRKREAFAAETPVATSKVIFVTDVKVGSERATYADVSATP
jgi:hypothetical protein